MSEDIRQIHIRAPERARVPLLGKLLWVALGCLLTPVYWVMAAVARGPGLGFHIGCVRVASRLLMNRTGGYPWRKAMGMIILPMDSTRYFEFDYVSRAVSTLRVSRYLDVSSPRIVPVSIARANSKLIVDLINPDAEDLEETRQMVRTLGLERQMRSLGSLISEVPFADSTFDLVTCISVVEHIPEDTEAVRKMWALLKPGGTLILTLPCMAVAAEQFIDLDTYKLLTKDRQGFVFWQRFYDRKLLDERVLSVVGKPVHVEIFGEKVAGSFYQNAQRKRRAHFYPFWREPYMMAAEYRHYDRIEALPGDGVIAMTFIKP